MAVNKPLSFLLFLSIGVLISNCDVIRGDAEQEVKTVQIKTQKVPESDFALNLSTLFPSSYNLESTEGLNSYTFGDPETLGDKYLFYKDNVETFFMVFDNRGEKVVAKVEQSLIDPAQCTSTTNFTSATISNTETIYIDNILLENLDFCGLDDNEIHWVRVSSPEDEGNYDTWHIAAYVGFEDDPNNARVSFEFDPLNGFTGTVEVSYVVSIGVEGTPEEPVGESWSSAHTVVITVTE